MFVSQRKYNALIQQLKMAADSSETYLSMYTTERASNARYRREHTQALQAVSHWQGRAERAEAKLADLQKPKRDAGAQAFDRIVKQLDFDRLEQRVLAHYAHQWASHHLTERVREQMKRATGPAYEGHAGEGGIQRHSIGDEYPFIVYAEEFRGCLRWRIMDSRSGHTLVDKYGCAENASSRARGLKKYDLRINAQGHAYHKE